MSLWMTADEFAALIGVIWVNIALSGDNAIVIGLAVIGLPPELRRKGIIFGIAAATVLRIVFALITTKLFAIVGLVLVGGLLLLWIAWKMWREVRERARQSAARAIDPARVAVGGAEPASTKTMTQALIQIMIADVSMSLDNVLAVAGLAREHPIIMVFGLVMSIALMGIASSYVAMLLERYHWLAYVGVAIIAYVGLEMVWDGGAEVYAFSRS